MRVVVAVFEHIFPSSEKFSNHAIYPAHFAFFFFQTRLSLPHTFARPSGLSQPAITALALVFNSWRYSLYVFEVEKEAFRRGHNTWQKWYFGFHERSVGRFGEERRPGGGHVT
jgi:hypothetical protein